MKIQATFPTFRPAIDMMIDTLPDRGDSGFTVERAEPKSNDLPKGTVSLYSIEDTSVDVAEIIVDGQTSFVVIEYGCGAPIETKAG